MLFVARQIVVQKMSAYGIYAKKQSISRYQNRWLIILTVSGLNALHAEGYLYHIMQAKEIIADADRRFLGRKRNEHDYEYDS